MYVRVVGVGLMLASGLAQLSWAQPLAVQLRTAQAEKSRLLEIERQLKTVTQTVEESPNQARPALEVLRSLIEARADNFKWLIKNEPAEALRNELPESLSLRIQGISSDLGLLIEQQGAWSGSLNVYIEHDIEHKTSRTVYRMLVGEAEAELHFADVPPALQCARISVRGVRLGNRIAVAAVERSAVSIPCSTTGVQNIAVIYARFPGTPFAADATSAYVQNTFFGSKTRSLNAFWAENSMGLTSASGVVVGPVTLDNDYTSCDSALIEAAAVKAADSLVDLRNYQRVFVVFPSRPGCDLASGQVGCGAHFSPSHGLYLASQSVLSIGANPPPNNLLTVIAHEGGHNLGLGHASSLDYGAIPLGPLNKSGVDDEYGDFFS
ncbi:MAG: hypothetical protein M3Z32_07035, partial [Acidobacteriota bacterium]|nr:hypothetical protein [Acidobacteriota bacterium]